MMIVYLLCNQTKINRKNKLNLTKKHFACEQEWETLSNDVNEVSTTKQ